MREWDRSLVGKLASSTRAVVFAHLRSIFMAAVDDELIAKNPCSARSVSVPRPVEKKVVPWRPEVVGTIRDGLRPRYRAIVDVTAGCGLRQGEVFGLADSNKAGERPLASTLLQRRDPRQGLRHGVQVQQEVELPPPCQREVEGEVELLAPSWLYLLAILPALFVVRSYSLTDVSLAQQYLATGVRALLLSTIVVALARPVSSATTDNIATVLLVASGLVSIATLKKHRGYVLLGIFVVAAFLTPPDAISQTAMAVPMYLLYEVGILLGAFVAKDRVARQAETEAADAGE